MTNQEGPANGLDKRPEVVERMFDRITPTYDRLNRMMSLTTDRGWRAKALWELAAERSDVVLDVATGTGDMALQAVRTSGCRVVGLDLSRNMLVSAVAKWDRERNDSPYPAVQGNALALPFRDGAFDGAMVAFGIRNMPNVGTFLDEACRVLRPGGRLVMLELSVPSNPLLRPIFLFHLTRMLPWMARTQGGDAAAYRYLSDSILAFPPPREIMALAESKGFRQLSSTALTMGACHLYVLQKDG